MIGSAAAGVVAASARRSKGKAPTMLVPAAVKPLVISSANGNIFKNGGSETGGALIYNNTFVSPRHAMNLQTPATVHDAHLVNNLFVGPAALVDGRTVDWSAPTDGVRR